MAWSLAYCGFTEWRLPWHLFVRRPPSAQAIRTLSASNLKTHAASCELSCAAWQFGSVNTDECITSSPQPERSIKRGFTTNSIQFVVGNRRHGSHSIDSAFYFRWPHPDLPGVL